MRERERKQFSLAIEAEDQSYIRCFSNLSIFHFPEDKRRELFVRNDDILALERFRLYLE